MGEKGVGGQSPHEICETTRALLADVPGDFKVEAAEADGEVMAM